MSVSDYTTSFTVDQTADEVFNAVTNVRGWWSEEVDGPTEHAGDEFHYHYRDIHRCTMRLTDVQPGRKVVWRVLDNYFNFVTDEAEWKGTDVIFDITPAAGGRTTLTFTHHGLVPEYECYDVCSNAWAGYIGGSLRSLIETGEGRPNPRETGDAPAHQEAATAARARSTVTATPAPGSILLGTTRPAELREWYRRALAPGH
ncbi:MAG: SRPBCC domain-containing protein, partial [Catenulispora sp.]|nr:SRPBCC domain-containing protein [Catenulispora sp.]